MDTAGPTPYRASMVSIETKPSVAAAFAASAILWIAARVPAMSLRSNTPAGDFGRAASASASSGSTLSNAVLIKILLLP